VKYKCQSCLLVQWPLIGFIYTQVALTSILSYKIRDNLVKWTTKGAAQIVSNNVVLVLFSYQTPLYCSSCTGFLNKEIQLKLAAKIANCDPTQKAVKPSAAQPLWRKCWYPSSCLKFITKIMERLKLIDLSNLVWWKLFLLMAGGWNQMSFKIPANPDHSIIPWLYDSCRNLAFKNRQNYARVHMTTSFHRNGEISLRSPTDLLECSPGVTFLPDRSWKTLIVTKHGGFHPEDAKDRFSQVFIPDH